MKRVIIQNCRVENKVYFCTSIYYHPHTYSIYNDIKLSHDIVTLDGRSPVTGNACELAEDLQKLFNAHNIIDRFELFV